VADVSTSATRRLGEEQAGGADKVDRLGRAQTAAAETMIGNRDEARAAVEGLAEAQAQSAAAAPGAAAELERKLELELKPLAEALAAGMQEVGRLGEAEARWADKWAEVDRLSGEQAKWAGKLAEVADVSTSATRRLGEEQAGWADKLDRLGQAQTAAAETIIGNRDEALAAVRARRTFAVGCSLFGFD
jgi:hypothetical protein